MKEEKRKIENAAINDSSNTIDQMATECGVDVTRSLDKVSIKWVMQFMICDLMHGHFVVALFNNFIKSLRYFNKRIYTFGEIQ